MKQVEVELDQERGLVLIKQDAMGQHEPDCVEISPRQAEAFCEWVREMAAQLEPEQSVPAKAR